METLIFIAVASAAGLALLVWAFKNVKRLIVIVVMVMAVLAMYQISGAANAATPTTVATAHTGWKQALSFIPEGDLFSTITTKSNGVGAGDVFKPGKLEQAIGATGY